MILVSPDSIRLSLFLCALLCAMCAVLLLPACLLYERQISPMGNWMLETMGDEVKSKKKREKKNEQMKVWYFSGIRVYIYWSNGGGKNTLYHCVWCFASVSALFPWELVKMDFHCEHWYDGVYAKWLREREREGKWERERERKIWSMETAAKLVHIFWRCCALFWALCVYFRW